MRNSSPRPVAFNATQQLKELDLFFRGKDQVHKTLKRLVKRLEKAHIPYAVLGGMALAVHRYKRATVDVDILLTGYGLAEFRRQLAGKHYDPVEGRPRRFTDRTNGVTIDILVTGRFPGSGKPGPVAFPNPDQVAQVIDTIHYVKLATLIELKLAARRYKDFGEVVELIRFNDLDKSFVEQLDASVRNDFIECLEEKRREDDYEAREG
jgi:hypothetical protein